MGLHDHRLSLADCCLPKAFFNTAFSMANCPQKRSNSATRATNASLSLSCLAAKASSPRASYSCRHRETLLLERLCARQICAGRFSPLANCRTTMSLNSRLNVRPGISLLLLLTVLHSIPLSLGDLT